MKNSDNASATLIAHEDIGRIPRDKNIAYKIIINCWSVILFVPLVYSPVAGLFLFMYVLV